MTPDVSVLLAAFRVDHPHHAVARGWLAAAVGAAASGAAFTVMPMVLAGFLRLVTSARVFRVPTPVADALGFIDALLAAAGVRLGVLGPEWPRLRRLCVEQQLGGNDVSGAWLAAATRQTGEHLVSFDRDFRKLLGRSHFTLLEPTPR